MMSDFQVQMFGDVQIRCAGRPVALPAGKVSELLCFLLLKRDRPHARDVVSETLWPDAGGDARKCLRQAIWRLRNTIPGEAGGTSLVDVSPDWIRINPDACYWLDVRAFEECHAGTRDIPGQHLSEEQAGAVEGALGLYRDDLLAAGYHDWSQHERHRLRTCFLDMVDQLMSRCEARGLHAKGIALGQEALFRDPARESTHRRLMRLHHAAGDRTAALRQYRHCAAAVATEFGVLPSDDTTTLYDLIRIDSLDLSR